MRTKILLIFLMSFIRVESKTLIIEDISETRNFSVNVNGDFYEDKTLINIDGYSAPLRVKVFAVNKRKPSFSLLMQRTLSTIQEENRVSNTTTIIDLLEERVKRYISIKDEARLRDLIQKHFKDVIKIYSDSKGNTLNKKMKALDQDRLEKGVLEIVNLCNDSERPPNKAVSLKDKELGDVYVEAYELGQNTENKLLDFIGKYKVQNSKADIRMGRDKKTLVFVHKRLNNKLLLINYLSAYDYVIDKGKESAHLLDFEFDRMVNKCTSGYKGQRVCYYFDKVESMVYSKGDLMKRVENNLPFYFESLEPLEKMEAIRDAFEATIVNIVNRRLR